ncbi:MAG: hypothetical protein ABIH21_00315 [Patescibacteria group bacterium]
MIIRIIATNNMDSEKTQKIERMQTESKIWSVVFDALFICDIEHDKIPGDLKAELRTIISDLLDSGTPVKISKPEKPQKKLSITQESLTQLQQTVIAQIDSSLETMGLTITQSIHERLSSAVLQIIQREKRLREKELDYLSQK